LTGISLGRTNLNVSPLPGRDTYDIEAVYPHPDFRSAPNDYADIAIIKTNRPVKYTENIWPFCLPEKNQVFKDFLIVNIAGWGVVNQSRTSPLIQTAFVNLVENSRCERIWRKHAQEHFDSLTTFSYPQGLTNQLLCAGREGVDACNGDSGGPMFHQDDEGLHTIIGVIAKGIKCSTEPIVPGFYTNIANYIDWIYSTTGIPRTTVMPSQRPVTSPQPNTEKDPHWCTQIDSANGCLDPKIKNECKQLCSVGDDPHWCAFVDPTTRCSTPSVATDCKQLCGRGCSSGFIMSEGSRQCFKLYKDKQRSWDEAKKKCAAEGLRLAQPTDKVAAALRRDLLDQFGEGYAWLDGRSDGTTMIWQQDQTLISSSNPLWWPGDPNELNAPSCLALDIEQWSWSREPEKPYYDYPCSKSDIYTLCQG
ncbi:unnamed protein product, partial [Meganyctiphanes norvegica]